MHEIRTTGAGCFSCTAGKKTIVSRDQHIISGVFLFCFVFVYFFLLPVLSVGKIRVERVCSFKSVTAKVCG